MQGPVNYFKNFGPDPKSKEKQLKTVKEGSGMIRNVYLEVHLGYNLKTKA